MQNSQSSKVLYSMLCERRHFLKNQKYVLILQKTQLLISKDLQTFPKYVIDINLNTVVDFRNKNSVTTFGLLYRGQMKYFHSMIQDLDFLRLYLKGKVMFLNIQSCYQILELVGEGSTAEVYRIKCHITGLILACKKMSRNSSQQSIDPKVMLINEMQTLQRLNHKNILKVNECFQDKDFYYMIMEFCAGGTLEEMQMLQKSQKFSYHDAEQIMKQILSLLRYQHDKKIIHRDIKLSNFMFKTININSLVCIDYGYCCEAYNSTLGFGTPGYISPEAFKSHQSGSWNDVFSSGVVFFKMLTGLNLFLGQSREELSYYNQNHIIQPEEKWTEISSKHRQIIVGMTHIDQQCRFSVNQIQNFLDDKKKLTVNNQQHISLQQPLEDIINDEVENQNQQSSCQLPKFKILQNNKVQGMYQFPSLMLVNTKSQLLF